MTAKKKPMEFKGVKVAGELKPKDKPKKIKVTTPRAKPLEEVTTQNPSIAFSVAYPVFSIEYEPTPEGCRVQVTAGNYNICCDSNICPPTDNLVVELMKAYINTRNISY